MNADNQEQAALILRAVQHALIVANQEAHNLDATDRWQTLIGAAVDQAHRLLTGAGIDPVAAGGMSGIASSEGCAEAMGPR